MPNRFDSLADRLAHCSGWVRQTFDKLERICRESGGEVNSYDEAKCEGRLFRVDGRRTAFCRLDPKSETLGIGFPNSIRSAVASTGRLRRQKNMAWITLRADDPEATRQSEVNGEVASLVRQANKVVRSGTLATSEANCPAIEGFHRLATLQWDTDGTQFRLDGDKNAWRRTRNFIYVWFDVAAKRCLNVGHTGLTFSGRFGSYVQWLNGKRKRDNDRPIRRAWLLCLANCQSGRVEVWVRSSAEDIKRRETDERHWIARLKPILNRR